jgi:hypothetical protein
VVSRHVSTLTRAYGRLCRMGYRPHHADGILRTASVQRLTEFQSGATIAGRILPGPLSLCAVCNQVPIASEPSIEGAAPRRTVLTRRAA